MIQEYDPSCAKPNLRVEKIIKHDERANKVTNHLEEVYVFHIFKPSLLLS